jgi:hypothetical protein
MKSRLVRHALLGLPFVLLFVVVRLAAPLLSRAIQHRAAGQGFASYEVAGPIARYDVSVAGARGRERAQAAAAALDAALAEVMARDRGRFRLRPPGRTIVLWLFDDAAALRRSSSFSLGEDLVHNDGYFERARSTIGLVDPRDPALLAAGLRHEGTHLLFSVVAPQGLSRWISEGLACYFERGPLAPEARRALAAVAGERPAERALGAGIDEFTAAGNERTYAAAELLVTWLLDDAPAPRREAFVDLVRAEMANGPMPASAALARLGADLETLDHALGRWGAMR